MKWNARQNGMDEELDEMRMEPALKEAIGNFRQSVTAWSEAAGYRPWRPVHAASHTTWRTATAWALGCLLAAASLGGGLYERQHRQELARLAAAEAQRQQQLQAAQNAAANTRAEDEKLLAAVDSDVSRVVPSAMEPLAKLMEGNVTQ